MTSEELVKFYVDLLILQYVKKPKARATIAALVQDVVADLISTQVRDAFDVQTGVGKQLDILGEYVGASRYQYGLSALANFWAKLNYGDLVGPVFGWSSYGDLTVGGNYLQYADLTSPTGTLTDQDYRRLLQYRATLRSMELTLENIDTLLQTYFGTTFYANQTADMVLTYTFEYHTTVAAEMPTILSAILTGKMLPRPAGVTITVVNLLV